MRFFLDTFRGWLVPVILIMTATLLTVPWSYWVIRAVYDRDIINNALRVAERVKNSVKFTNQNPGAQVAEALGTELATENAVSLAAFYSLNNPVPQFITWVRKTEVDNVLRPERLSVEELRRRMDHTLVEQYGELYIISVPWKKDGNDVGVIYLELSRPKANAEFWQKEGSLVKRVGALTAAAILVMSCVGIYAYGTRMRMNYVSERAELARQGLLAERGLTAAVLAHEIRNPLAALRFQLHSLRKNALDENRVHSTADTIDAELSRIQQLVTDYLEHEKARSMRVQAVDLEESARSLQTLLRELFRQTRTEFVVDAPQEPVLVTCDPHALRQILMNLVLNAQQAMGQDGHVTLRIGRDHNFGTLDVADTGPGIPAEIRDNLFKPFQTSKAEGQGIGLALVKRFVDNFGGSVTVESAPETGTTFRLRLPLAVPTAIQQGFPVSPPPLPAPLPPSQSV